VVLIGHTNGEWHQPDSSHFEKEKGFRFNRDILSLNEFFELPSRYGVSQSEIPLEDPPNRGRRLRHIDLPLMPAPHLRAPCPVSQVGGVAARGAGVRRGGPGSRGGAAAHGARPRGGPVVRRPLPLSPQPAASP
jgi:hypothetical protein